MYTSALNTAETKGVQMRLRWGVGAKTLTASLQDVRIFLMPYDMAGIYNSEGELAVAHNVPE